MQFGSFIHSAAVGPNDRRQKRESGVLCTPLVSNSFLLRFSFQCPSEFPDRVRSAPVLFVQYRVAGTGCRARLSASDSKDVGTTKPRATPRPQPLKRLFQN